MSDTTIRLKVITPVAVLFEGEVKSFIVKTNGEAGEFAVLANHAPMTAALGIGKLVLRLPDGSEKLASVFEGYCIVKNNNAVIIVEAGEKPEDIDKKRAEAAKKRAEEHLNDVNSDRKRAERALRRSKVRLELYNDLK